MLHLVERMCRPYFIPRDRVKRLLFPPAFLLVAEESSRQGCYHPLTSKGDPMTTASVAPAGPGRGFLDMNGYQWTVLFAAWLGWGFDVFDGLLFNFVAPNCVPTLLGLTIGSP